MNQHFGGVHWTNHALARMHERGISQSDAWATWKNPQLSRYAERKHAWVYYRTWRGERIEVVATKNQQNQWVILSVWNKPISEERQTPKTPSLWNRILNRLLKL